MKKKRRLQRSDRLWMGAAALMVLLQFWWLPGERRAPDDTYSTSIEGKRGFFETLQTLSQAGVLPEVRRETQRLIPEGANNCTLLILSPDRYPDSNEQEELARYIANGNSLLFAPNWTDGDVKMPGLSIDLESTYFRDEDTVTATVPPTVTQTAEEEVETDTQAEAEDPTSSPPDETDAQKAARRAAERAASSSKAAKNQSSAKTTDDEDDDEDDKNMTPRQGTLPSQNTEIEDLAFEQVPVSDINTQSELVEGRVLWRTKARMNAKSWGVKKLVTSVNETTQVASWAHGSGRVMVSASPDVFSNRAMLNSGQAELAIRLVEYAHQHHYDPQTPIIVCEYLNASQSYQQTGVLMSPSLRSGSLQLLLVTVLAGWFGFHRFGPARRATSSQRRSLEESADAVGNLYYRTGSGSAAVSAYLDYANSQLRKQFGNSVQLTDSQAIALRTGLNADDIAQVIDEAIALTKGRGSPSACAASIRAVSEIVKHLRGEN